MLCTPLVIRVRFAALHLVEVGCPFPGISEDGQLLMSEALGGVLEWDTTIL